MCGLIIELIIYCSAKLCRSIKWSLKYSKHFHVSETALGSQYMSSILYVVLSDCSYQKRQSILKWSYFCKLWTSDNSNASLWHECSSLEVHGVTAKAKNWTANSAPQILLHDWNLQLVANFIPDLTCDWQQGDAKGFKTIFHSVYSGCIYDRCETCWILSVYQ